MPLNRRTFLSAATATGGLLALGTPATPAAAAPGGFPDYRHLGTLLTPGRLSYNPTGEIIFPCVRGVYDRLSAPLGRYYLYYAPHDAPGGICLAYADSIAGPYTEYPGNPIVSNRWSPHYSVSHVSSPHVMWHEGERELWLYFHGENTTTRLARSSNGIDFVYDRTVLTTSMLPSGTTEASYARVFPHALPDRGARYVMLFMMNTTANHRSIGWGWSPDGRSWSFASQPLIRYSDIGVNDLSGPHLLTRNGSAYVVYHTDRASGGTIRITEVGADFSRRDHLGVFYRPLAGAPDNGRAAAPAFGTDRGVPYMIYEAGERLAGSIAIARG
ncbi:twin-arginine translocation signal domain-containing protein [Streptomyces sp. NPDC127098]|uniref:twin-arginine translocation signal domain-containing protein n=1 Tax=Streptomyces sp. NPDC127098 TaxID=3347137 RepID=UPI0036677FB4